MNNGQVLYYDAGDTATIILQSDLINNKYVEYIDPKIQLVFGPDLKPLPGFPAPLYHLEQLDKKCNGLYAARIKLPSGAASGTYLCLLSYLYNDVEHKTMYTIIVRKSAFTSNIKPA